MGDCEYDSGKFGLDFPRIEPPFKVGMPDAEGLLGMIFLAGDDTVDVDVNGTIGGGASSVWMFVARSTSVPRGISGEGWSFLGVDVDEEAMWVSGGLLLLFAFIGDGVRGDA